ncbi:hypothetical protein Tco_0189992 [Tanacetum coccineum]
MAQVHLLQSQKEKLEQQKAKAEAKHVRDMEIELPGDLKEIPTKLETFTSIISSLTSQGKLKTLDSFPSLLNKVTVVETASGAASKNVPSAGQATASPTKGEKNTNPAIRDAEPTNLYNELVDLLGIDFVTQEDGTVEVIPNVKVNDLHLAKWKEVVQACLDKKEKGWKTIYGLIKTRMEYLNQTKKELKTDFNKPLKEQDPLNELNDLANKKRKRTGNSKYHSRSSKKHKSSVQHEEESLSLKEITPELSFSHLAISQARFQGTNTTCTLRNEHEMEKIFRFIFHERKSEKLG